VRSEVAAVLTGFAVEVVDSAAEIGSGALPGRSVPSAAVAIAPLAAKARGGALKRLAAAFRALPVPVIGRVQDDAYVLDCRGLEDTDAFIAQLGRLAASDPAPR
jgi:L-seryl-tRNA(Ser) seleniumtransferase